MYVHILDLDVHIDSTLILFLLFWFPISQEVIDWTINGSSA